jgi:hypothetical protein
MPGLNGVELANAISAIRPAIRVLLMSEFSDVESRLPIIRKPFGMGELLASVGDALRITAPQPARTLFDDRSVTETVETLTADLNAARKRYLDSERLFLQLTSDVPSAIPHLDGVARIQRAAEARRKEFHNYQHAQSKLQEYLALQTGGPDVDGRTDEG